MKKETVFVYYPAMLDEKYSNLDGAPFKLAEIKEEFKLLTGGELPTIGLKKATAYKALSDSAGNLWENVEEICGGKCAILASPDYDDDKITWTRLESLRERMPKMTEKNPGGNTAGPKPVSEMSMTECRQEIFKLTGKKTQARELPELQELVEKAREAAAHYANAKNEADTAQAGGVPADQRMAAASEAMLKDKAEKEAAQKAKEAAKAAKEAEKAALKEEREAAKKAKEAEKAAKANMTPEQKAEREAQIKALRAQHHKTVVTLPNGEKKEFKSVYMAFSDLDLPVHRHVPFRQALKAAGMKDFEHNGKTYHFEAIAVERQSAEEKAAAVAARKAEREKAKQSKAEAAAERQKAREEARAKGEDPKDAAAKVQAEQDQAKANTGK